VTYRLDATKLSVDVSIRNPDLALTLPFGFGLHPYFTCPNAPGAAVDEMVLMTTASKIWETVEGMPTGQILAVPAELDFMKARPIGGLVLDTLFTELNLPTIAGKYDVAKLRHATEPGELTLRVTNDFRELLLFTPPHRKAIAIEPYTCATDAANLEASGINAGWRNIAPGVTFETGVEYEWNPT